MIDGETAAPNTASGVEIDNGGFSTPYLHLEGIEFCSLCNRYVSPKKRGYGPPLILGITSLVGLIFAYGYDVWLARTGYYLNVVQAYLGAELEIAATVFFVLLVGSIVWLIYISLQKKRCPICNTRI